MDISSLTDITQLKAMAFDAIQAIEVNQRNLTIIQRRIEEVSTELAEPLPKSGQKSNKS